MPRERPAYRIKTAANVFDIIRTLHQYEGATLDELDGEIDLARSTLYDYLQTLIEMGYVVRDDGAFYLSLEFLNLGNRAKLDRTAWKEVKPALKEIGDETGENIWFVVEENGKAVYVDHYSGDRVLYTFNKSGTREHLHCIAAGKAILAHLPDERVDEIIDRHGLPAFTDNTITDREELRAEFETIRERGVAFSRGERRAEIRGVATPIIDGDSVLGAITLGAPSKRLTGQFFTEELPNLVTGAANRIEFSFQQPTPQ
ncbi:IclR family transcriptional regulator [Halobellus captivus]|uniref:IclR family transcriptional regulator n=1 Tax=Halobellus captivus TaxID=2592614 RepID=UPI0011A53051|nr:IclR family transcriptional regulator [Halobellus captivus]